MFSYKRILAVAAGAAAVVLLQTQAPSMRAQSDANVTVNPVLFKGLQYRLVGHSRGGRVTTVTGVPSQPETFYMGVASGGLFRTTDNGRSWTPITDGQVPLGSSGDVAVALSDPNVIYYGTGSDGLRSNVSTGRGVYKSVDAGKTWTFAGLYNAGQIGAVRIHPTNPNVVWVAAYGDAFKANPDRGIFKTTDGGATWKKTLFMSDQIGAMDVELQPGNPDVVFAWMNRIERKPWTIISGSEKGGFFKSTDGGETFAQISNGLPNKLIGKGNIAVTAANPQRLYALVEALPGGGMYRSDDAGQTWKALPSPAAMIQRPFYYTTLGADPTNADVVYGGAEGFYKSADGGMTWQTIRTPHGDNHDIWVNPKNGNIMVQANDGGANVSTDGGRTWSTQTNQVTAEFYGVWTDNQFPYNLYVAQQDGSTFIIPSVRDPYDMSALRDGPGCETGPIMPHPKNPNVVYGSCKGQYSWMNLVTGQEKQYWIGAQSLYGNAGRDLILRFQRVSPMATDPFDPEVLYYGSQHVHRTRDKGVTWETISPDLTANPDCCQGASGEPITRDVTGEEFFSTLYAITPSPLERGVIWTGANDGPFHITRDNGKTWKNITPKDLPDKGRVAWIDASPHRPGSAYYAVYRYLLGDYAPYIYKTDDYGTTWTRVTTGKNGIPADTPTRVVREDPGRAGLLYAGTEFGIYVSFDDGAHWQPLQLNLPNVPINDIRVYKNDLIIATQGRALWSLDNVTALQQMTPQVSAANVHLFKPRDGYRTRVSPGTLGPTLDYYLPAVPAGPVTIEILDAGGKTVLNRYSSDAPAGGGRAGRGGRGGRGGGRGAGGGDPDDPDTAMMAGRTRGGAAAVAMNVVTKNVGLNRFVWDVQHENGLVLPPATYQARLTVNGQASTQPFNVLIDPNLADEGMTAADLQQLYDHNLRARELNQRATALAGRVRQALQQAQAGSDKAKLVALTEVGDQLLTPSIRYSKPGLQSHISYLAGMTGRVDQKVGKDALDRYEVLKKELDALEASFNKIMGGGL
jgi:photosystem II stability/assembly factor-like uncharacterized protein